MRFLRIHTCITITHDHSRLGKPKGKGSPSSAAERAVSVRAAAPESAAAASPAAAYPLRLQPGHQLGFERSLAREDGEFIRRVRLLGVRARLPRARQPNLRERFR
jgi:hypothetical protein